MEPVLSFDVTNQHIRRTDSFRVVAKSKNYLMGVTFIQGVTPALTFLRALV